MQVDPDTLLAWARERLVDHKAPRRIWVVADDEIPRAAHRVRRGELRERYRNTFAEVGERGGELHPS